MAIYGVITCSRLSIYMTNYPEIDFSWVTRPLIMFSLFLLCYCIKVSSTFVLHMIIYGAGFMAIYLALESALNANVYNGVLVMSSLL